MNLNVLVKLIGSNPEELASAREEAASDFAHHIMAVFYDDKKDPADHLICLWEMGFNVIGVTKGDTTPVTFFLDYFKK